MRHITGLFLCFFFLLPEGRSNAQEAITTEIPTINQLPTKGIQSIFQDSEGYMWYGTIGGLCRDDGYQINVFRADFKTPGLLESNSITTITEDQEKKIWFGTKRGVYILDKNNYEVTPLPDSRIKSWDIKMITAASDGTIWISSGRFLFRFNASGEKLGEYEVGNENLPKEITDICEDKQGFIWMVQSKGGLFKYDALQDKVIEYPWPYERPAACMLKDAVRPYFWIGTWGDGIVRFDPEEKEIDKMFVLQQATSNHANIDKRRIFDIAQDSTRHNLWVTTTDNLYTYEITQEDNLRFVDTSDFLSDTKKLLTNLMCDHLGNIWVVGNYPDSYSFIVSYLPNKMISHAMDKIEDKFGVAASPMKFIHEKDYYWVRQKRLGIYIYEPQYNTFSMFENQNRSISFSFEKSADHDGVYVAVFDSKVIWIQYDGKHFSETEICSIPVSAHERIRTLCDDGEGNLWIGTTYSLYAYDLKQKISGKVFEDTGIINEIVSNKGRIYIATESEGFWEIADGRRTYKHFTKENYTVLTVSNDDKIWTGTSQGNLYCYDPASGGFISETENCGLIGDEIIDLLADDYGNIWILTDQRITIYNPDKQILNLINCSDPSISLDNFSSLNKKGENEIQIGGKGGIIELSAIDQFEKTIRKPLIWLTSVKINNVRKIVDGDSRSIVLNPHERNIELFFSTFDLLNTNKIRFAFRQKQDSIWNYLPVGQNNIYLAGLSKGNYELEVWATDENGSWTKKATTIQIQCLPAWYESWWAYSLYFFLVLIIAAFIIQKYIETQRNKQQKQMEEQVSQMKYRFFTNISHELRTPLALIITPLETITQKITDSKIRKQLEAVSRNAQNLLSLVNQLLDFRKIEMKGETLSLVKTDINAFTASVYDDFHLITEEKKIHFSYHSEITSCYLFFDPNKLKKIINNLLSNAFKFTGEGGSISLSIGKETKEGETYVVIAVADTGKGIPANELSSIFERFHQVQGKENEAGSGIGLHIVNEYVNMHEGDVVVQSELGKGTTFSVYIPTHLKPNATTSSSTDTYSIQDVAPVEPLVVDLEKKILIVEDNVEFRAYIKNELSRFYTVYEADNGLEGEKEASEKEPDIIITDLMMPGIDGIELCRRIKNNLKTSHIPVILLTANTNIENEKRGYKEGADAYIGKPFHWEILLSRISNLLKQKIQRQQIFKSELEVDPKEITISSLDEKLIKKIVELLELNMKNSTYSIDDLSRDMYMSRTSLYRKVNTITGLSPTDFVRNIRLKKAAELLIKHPELTVVEVAYEVGFNTPSYFTKAFKNLFGVLPSQYKAMRENQ